MITGIVDVSHWEEGADVEAAARANTGGPHDLVMLLAKTGQGIDAPDRSFGAFRDATYRAGLLFGDYHFPTSLHSGAEQARDYMSRWDPSAAMHVVDAEVNPNDRAHTVTRPHLEEFVHTIADATGVLPWFYTYPSFVHELGITADSILARCPFWLASYGERPLHAPAPFSKFDLWQYSDFHNGPHDAVKYPRTTPGLGRKVDRSCFDGTLGQFKAMLAAAGR